MNQQPFPTLPSMYYPNHYSRLFTKLSLSYYLHPVRPLFSELHIYIKPSTCTILFSIVVLSFPLILYNNHITQFLVCTIPTYFLLIYIHRFVLDARLFQPPSCVFPVDSYMFRHNNLSKISGEECGTPSSVFLFGTLDHARA